jgi:hypothetical protein
MIRLSEARNKEGKRDKTRLVKQLTVGSYKIERGLGGDESREKKREKTQRMERKKRLLDVDSC